MITDLPVAGSADAALVKLAHEVFIDCAAKCGLDLFGFDPSASLAKRVAWAIAHGFEIGTILSRFSSKLQQSTTAQVHDCLQGATARRIYVPPEYICVDEGKSGRKVQRDGLNRAKQILASGTAKVLLVFKVSRLLRVAYLGFQFFNEEVVEEGLRAISVSQGIDTNDKETWKLLCYMHGIMDEMLLSAIADHSRSGLRNLFRDGYVSGALTLGYAGVEVPEARPTNMGKPRRMPATDPLVASIILQHYEWNRDGVPLREGWRRWVAASGPRDPRSTSDYMSYSSYRRMLSNARYTGTWAFGRMRNSWSTKRDYTRQIAQPETEVILVRSEELRIIPDELFFAVQERLAKLKKGPSAPKKRKELHLWDLVTGCFFCGACSTPEKPIRLYQAGAHGRGMQCKRSVACPCLTTIRRDVAVRYVCEKLTELLQQDPQLIELVVGSAMQIEAAGEQGFSDQLLKNEEKIRRLTRKISDLADMAGDGSEEDRLQLQAKVKAAQQERASLQVEHSQLQRLLTRETVPITSDRVREIVSDLTSLLQIASADDPSGDAVYRAATIFELLVGGQIMVHVEQRPGRKHTNVRGTFVPRLLHTVRSELQDPRVDGTETVDPVEVWLRKPPRNEMLAEAVHQLIDIEGHSFRSAADVLQAQGHRLNSGVVWQIYQRYWQMIGQPPPQRPYNNGHQRKPKAG